MLNEVPGKAIELPPIESIPLSPDILRLDNRTPLADNLRGAYEANAGNGSLIGVEGCGDARAILPLPEMSVPIRSISTAGPKDYGIFRDTKIKYAVVVTHISGDTLEVGKMPTGCGGLTAKLSVEELSNEGIGSYIKNNIVHPDPIVQALVTANRIVKESGKPTLAAVQDHLTTKLYPIAVFSTPIDYKSYVDLVGLMVKYDPEQIYANLIPTLKDSDIPDVFKEYLEAANSQMRTLLMNYANFKENQRVQNPRMVVLSTEPRSMRLRYPTTSSRPGFAFKLHVPRQRLESGRIAINPEVLEGIVKQAQYPFEHSADHNNHPEKDFSKTDIFLVETGDIDVSNQIVKRLAQEKWMQKWLSQKDHEIWIGETNEGITSRIEPFVTRIGYASK